MGEENRVDLIIAVAVMTMSLAILKDFFSNILISPLLKYLYWVLVIASTINAMCVKNTNIAQ